MLYIATSSFNAISWTTRC